MTIHVILTTYNRPDYYAELVPKLLEMPGVELHVYNDGSTVPYPHFDGLGSYRMAHHHGVERYKDLVGFAFKRARASQWDRIAMIPDDVTPAVVDPFSIAEYHWQTISDPKQLLLGMMVDKRGHIQQWRGKIPRKHGGVWMTDWNDLCFYSDTRLQRLLPRGFGAKHPLAAGSGVGAMFTRHLRRHGTLYCVDQTLWHHRQGESQMNPWERKLHPL